MLKLRGEPLGDGDGEDKAEVILSVVVDEGEERRRKLPSLFLGTTQIFAHREIGSVVARMEDVLSAFLRSEESILLAAHSCEYQGVTGLYARDLFNRAPYRRKLVRSGVSFTECPYTELKADGSCYVPDIGGFRPAFVVLGDDSAEPTEVVRTSPARVGFTLASLRLGQIKPRELNQLVALARSTPGLSAGDPSALAKELRSLVA